MAFEESNVMGYAVEDGRHVRCHMHLDTVFRNDVR